MKIDDQSQWNIEQFHVAQKLRWMDRKNLFNGFYFDKQATVNQQIKAEGLLPAKLLVPDDYLVLVFHLMVPQSEFHR